MARLWQCGAEENSLTSGVEVASGTGAGLTITSTAANVRSGTYAFKFKTTGANSAHLTGGVIDATNVIYSRCWVYVVIAPTTACKLMDFTNDLDNNVGIKLNTDGSLGLWDFFNNAQLGSNSSVLTLNTWYMVEMFCDTTTLSSVTGTARLNGSQFATGTGNQTGSGHIQYIGFGDTVNNTYEFYVDDISVNDNSGSDQNSWPGNECIIHLRPSAAGDNNAWVTQTGGTAGAANNFTRVNEVTPNDATSLNGDKVLNNKDDFNIDDTPAILDGLSTIRVVALSARYSGAGASANSSFVLRCKKAASGTVSESSALTPANTTFRSGTLTSLQYPLVLYKDPDSNPWTKATLDTAQIGYRTSTASTNNARVSTVWMSVAYTPPNAGKANTILQAVKRSSIF